MKWLAFLLLLLNAGIWFGADYWLPRPVHTIASDQTLPRVSTLKVGAEMLSQSVDSSEDQAPEPESSVEEESVQQTQAPEPVDPAPVEPMCVRLGWFETADEARQAYESLGQTGPLLSVSEQERALAPLHWVIIPPQPEDRALAQFNDLQRRNIDSYLVTQGENTNAISLGLFQSKAAAERVLAQKKRQNLNAVLANFPRNELSYALVFEALPVAENSATEGRVEDYREDFEMVEISACEGIATTPENP